VRELRNLIERAAALADADTLLEREDFILGLEELPGHALPSTAASAAAPGSVYEEISREEGERLRATLKTALGNKARAARMLGIARTTLNDRLRKYGVD
jgi:DNA-binding NtrC family response regulator